MEATLTTYGEAILKKELARLLPKVKSSHRAEAMARGLGFKSKIALDAARKALEIHERGVDCTIAVDRFTAFLKDRGYRANFEEILAEAVQFLHGKPAKLALGNPLPRYRRVTIDKDMPMEERVRRYIHNSAVYRQDPDRFHVLMGMYPHLDDDPDQIQSWFEGQATMTARMEATIRQLATLPDDAELPSPFEHHSVEDLFDQRGPIEPFEKISEVAEARGWKFITADDLAAGPHLAVNLTTGEARQVFPKK